MKLLVALVAFAVGCGTSYEVLDPPRLEIDTPLIDLGVAQVGKLREKSFEIRNVGGAPLGIGSIRPWSGDDASSFKIVHRPTGTGPVAACCEPEEEAAAAVVLAPGASTDVWIRFTGERAGFHGVGLIVETVGDPSAASAGFRAYHADPAHAWSQVRASVWVDAPAELAVPERDHDLGWPRAETLRSFPLLNVGEVSLTVEEVRLDAGCDDAFSLVEAPEAGTVLDAAQGAVVWVAFAGSPDPAACSVWVDSTDANEAQIEVELVANQGTDPRAGTRVVDVDGDGFTGKTGDCDDNDAKTFPDAPEVRDGKDNDCDGLVDEATVAFDDDGDGVSEVEGDCDDADPLASPAAREICRNDRDDDCDGGIDEGGCLLIDDCGLTVVGRVDLEQTSVEEGATVQVSMLTLTTHGQAVTQVWSAKEAEGAFDPADASDTVWTAPELPEDHGAGKTYNLYWTGTCDQGVGWEFVPIRVVPRGFLDQPILVFTDGGSG